MRQRIVFLFGAGASKGAGHTLPFPPPQGLDVYDKLAREFPSEWGSGSRLGRYAAGLRQDFEGTMFKEVCTWEASLSVLEWQRTMALFFSRFVLDSTSRDLYSRLLLALQASGRIHDAVFASLNYDYLLEQAANRIGLGVDFFGKEQRQNNIVVFKLHGSCTFVTPDISGSRHQLTNPNSALGCGMEWLPPDNVESALVSRFSDPRTSHYPVVSLYSLGKNSLVGGTQVQEIRNAWTRCMSNAAVVAIVGVRPSSEDGHVWKPISSTSAKLLYIGSQKDFHKWKSANASFEIIGTAFEDGFEALLEHVLHTY